ncbi:MAG: hypothetical protein K1Y36_02530 [Blastocatellia bacterium]|nr:hypothetical protein [Blastocatellia bacterium]
MSPLLKRTKLVVWAMLLMLVTVTSVSAGEKPKPEEIIAKHLESLGKAENRKASRIINGQSQFFLRVGNSATINGKTVLASEENKNLLAMIFDTPQYPHEKMGFDGEKFTAAAGLNARRPPLSDFIYANNEVFGESLIGGALSANWGLLYADKRQAKIQYGGTKKINGRELHVLNYFPKKLSAFKIKLFFDTETFRHVRTEYEILISAQMGTTPENSSQQREQRNRLIEDFSDFKEEGGLMLPHTYKLEIIINGTSGSQQLDWQMNLDKFEFGQAIDPKSYRVTTGN